MKDGREPPDTKTPDREKINSLVVEMLVCPLTKTQLSLNADKTELVSRGARVAFPITKGVPLLCLDEARTLDEDEIENLNPD